jgi:hypothetical protein
MKLPICVSIGCLIIFSFPLYAQTDSAIRRANWTKLEQELNLALRGMNKDNIVNSKNAIINSGITAMQVAERINR